MKIEIDVDIPRGFEATGEYRRVQVGEWFLHTRHGISRAFNSSVHTICNHIILRKMPQLPTMEHVGQKVLVRMSGDLDWQPRVLLFVDRDGFWCRTGIGDKSLYAFRWDYAKLID